MDLEFNTHGTTNALDIEDLYMTTKVGMVDVKGGNYATGTSAIMGEIDEGFQLPIYNLSGARR
jgi:hypothetical protein